MIPTTFFYKKICKVLKSQKKFRRGSPVISQFSFYTNKRKNGFLNKNKNKYRSIKVQKKICAGVPQLKANLVFKQIENKIDTYKHFF